MAKQEYRKYCFGYWPGWRLLISFYLPLRLSLRCTVGYSDFGFVTFWHPKGPRIWKLAKKVFQLIRSWQKAFAKKPDIVFFVILSKFNFRNPVLWISTFFSMFYFFKSVFSINTVTITKLVRRHFNCDISFFDKHIIIREETTS